MPATSSRSAQACRTPTAATTATAATDAAPSAPCRRAAVFIDKDGTLIENVPYNADPALLRFMPGAFAALAALSAAGFALVVVSNQSGLALRKFTLPQFVRLCDVLRQQLQLHAGVALVDLLSCPHLPGADGRPICACRKPQPWMIERAAGLHGLDLQRSWMVGDTLDDVEAGRRAGCRALLFDSGGETEWRDGPLRSPESRLPDWAAVARHILGAQAQAQTQMQMQTQTQAQVQVQVKVQTQTAAQTAMPGQPAGMQALR